MAFQLALGCTGGTTHRECCDECDPTTCSLTVVHEVDGSITVTWTYSSPYETVTAATLNGVDILGDPNTDTGIATYTFANLPDELTLIVTNVCGDSTCEYHIPCCWKYDTLRVSFRNVTDIALSCSEYQATARVRQYDYTLDITGLTALNGTWLLDLTGGSFGEEPLMSCIVDGATDIYVGDVDYVVDTEWSGPRPFGLPGTQETHRWATIPGKLYIRKQSPTGIFLAFIPDDTYYTLNHSYWDDNSTGSPVVGSTTICLDPPLAFGGAPPCGTTGWRVGFITQPVCGAANTDYLETAIYTPFSFLSRPPLYNQSAALPPFDLFNPPQASRCPSLIANVPLEVDVEYL